MPSYNRLWMFQELEKSQKTVRNTCPRVIVLSSMYSFILQAFICYTLHIERKLTITEYLPCAK